MLKHARIGTVHTAIQELLELTTTVHTAYCVNVNTCDCVRCCVTVTNVTDSYLPRHLACVCYGSKLHALVCNILLLARL
jgi:hypothetical protein